MAILPLAEIDEIEMRVALRVAAEDPAIYLAKVKTHLAIPASKDLGDRLAYERVHAIQECLFANLADVCGTLRADGKPCGRLEGEHSHDDFCPSDNWYSVNRKFRKAA